jgi:SAM-dependent methyltransferase
MTTQNIYDDPDFFAGYAKLPRSEHGLGIVYEWPAFQRLLPASLADNRVLDLGCGLGYFAREARARGARQVIGVDLSERMLEEARRRTDDAGIDYVRASLEEFATEPGSFDLVVSSLALHYIADYAGLARRVATWLSRADGSSSRWSIQSSPRMAAATGTRTLTAPRCTGRWIATATKARGVPAGSSTAW